MKFKFRRIIFSILTLIFILGSIPLLAFFENKLIQVEAGVSYYLSVWPRTISLGTVFPQELFKRRDLIILLNPPAFQVEGKQVKYVKKLNYQISFHKSPDYPLICQALGVLPWRRVEPRDKGIDLPHDMTAKASGELGLYDLKRIDLHDLWQTKFLAPCFEGMCDQNYLALFTQQPSKVPQPLPPDLEGEILGCDLKIEVTNIEYGYIPLP